MLNTITVIAISKTTTKKSDSQNSLWKAILKIAYNKAKGNILGLNEYSKLLRMQSTKLYFECYSQKICKRKQQWYIKP